MHMQHNYWALSMHRTSRKEAKEEATRNWTMPSTRIKRSKPVIESFCDRSILRRIYLVFCIIMLLSNCYANTAVASRENEQFSHLCTWLLFAKRNCDYGILVQVYGQAKT